MQLTYLKYLILQNLGNKLQALIYNFTRDFAKRKKCCGSEQVDKCTFIETSRRCAYIKVYRGGGRIQAELLGLNNWVRGEGLINGILQHIKLTPSNSKPW